MLSTSKLTSECCTHERRGSGLQGRGGRGARSGDDKTSERCRAGTDAMTEGLGGARRLGASGSRCSQSKVPSAELSQQPISKHFAAAPPKHTPDRLDLLKKHLQLPSIVLCNRRGVFIVRCSHTPPKAFAVLGPGCPARNISWVPPTDAQRISPPSYSLLAATSHKVLTHYRQTVRLSFPQGVLFANPILILSTAR